MSYRKVGLTTMTVTQDLHSGTPLVLILNKNSTALGTVYYLNLDNPVPNYHNSYTPHCMQEDPACNGPVVKDSSYPLNSRLLRHAYGQALAGF